MVWCDTIITTCTLRHIVSWNVAPCSSMFCHVRLYHAILHHNIYVMLCHAMTRHAMVCRIMTLYATRCIFHISICYFMLCRRTTRSRTMSCQTIHHAMRCNVLSHRVMSYYECYAKYATWRNKEDHNMTWDDMTLHSATWCDMKNQNMICNDDMTWCETCRNTPHHEKSYTSKISSFSAGPQRYCLSIYSTVYCHVMQHQMLSALLLIVKKLSIELRDLYDNHWQSHSL